MDTKPSINETWRVCTTASFVSITILIFYLSYGQDALNNSTLRIVSISIPSSSIDTEPLNIPLNTTENENRHEVEKCNLYDGKWVYDPKASPLYNAKQCPFLSEQVSCRRNGRPDFEYEKWSWEAKGCKIPRFDGKDMLERLRGRRVIIVGDSLNRNQWESLACLLYSSLRPSRAHVEYQSGSYKVFKAKDYNCSVEFHWSPFLVQLEVEPENGTKILKLDKLSELEGTWRGANVMVFNTGHWWAHRGKFRAWDLFQYDGKMVENMETESAMAMAMNTWANWIDQNIDTSETTVFFRSISPEHKGKQLCYNRTRPMMMDESFEETFPRSMIQAVEKTIAKMKTQVKYLNITKLSEYRRDAHPSVYAKKQQLIATQERKTDFFSDCSHWCLPGLPDTWSRLLYASLVLDTSSDISTF